MNKFLICALALALSQALAAQAPADAQRQAARAAEQAQADAARSQATAARSQATAAQAAGLGELAELRAMSALGGSLAGASARKPTEQEELAITALEGLMTAPPERALPLLTRVLEGKQSDLVKSRALFVLSQIGLPQAQTQLLAIARSGSGELRAEAIRMIGVGGDAESLAALKTLYSGADPVTREAILNAYLIADRKQEVLELALKAKDTEESDALVRTLAAMGALDELRKLGDAGKTSTGLVQAYAIAGDLASLRKLAGSDNPEIRLEAIRSIGITDGKEGSAALAQIYREAKDADSRDAALQGLLISGDEQALLGLYRSVKDSQQKNEILRTLTFLGGDAAIEAIDAALQGQQP
jgi:HEAT repeat protein